MFYVILIFLFLFFVLPYLILIKKCPANVRESIWWLIKNGKHSIPFSSGDTYGMGKGFIFCPHPYTNWSLNPSHVNASGEKIHTKEGFRKTFDEDSIYSMIDKYKDFFKIVVIGGSTSYCSDMRNYCDTWPAQLHKKLHKDKVVVINFAVSGWNTVQSVIRCVNWLPVVKPDLLIFYQAKNDLTPLYNGKIEEKMIYPDYQNVTTQFLNTISFMFPRRLLYIPLFYLIEAKRLRTWEQALLYRRNGKPNLKGLERFDKDLKNAMTFRVESLISICNILKCKVLYIPEIVRRRSSDKLSLKYSDILDDVYKDIKSTLAQYDNACFFDIRGTFPDEDQYFQDKLHFNEKGCEFFSNILVEKIKEMNVLKK